jgi:Domain of unknown function (DUF4037)
MPSEPNIRLNISNREDRSRIQAASKTHDLTGLAADPDRLPASSCDEGAVSDAGSREDNVHAAWRLEEAKRAARAYGSNQKLAALAVAGSVGTGLADRFSDLELDCYWLAPPNDLDRLGPIRALGGESEVIWDYAPDIEEWSDDYQLGDLHVSISSFLVATIERFLDDVVLWADTDPVKHIRLAALRRSVPLLGPELMTTWRARAALYPDQLVAAMVEQSLDPQADVLRGWAARDALVERGDDLAVHALLTRVAQAVFSVLLAINRVYSPNPMFKWQKHLIEELDVMPEQFAERLQLLPRSGEVEALRIAEALMVDTIRLVRSRTDAGIASFCEALSERRPAIDPPRTDQRSALL